MIIEIDGKKVEAGEAKTVLEVARANDIWIPTLCHHESLSDYGACRLCLVEVIRRGRTKVTASCTLPVMEGMEIVTNSDRIARLRRLVMELILASCPRSEAVIEMAEKLGARDDRLERDSSSDCIRCGLCVRACAEMSGAAAINFAHRGVNRTVTTPFDIPSSACLLCGACVSVCPTGSRLLDLARISGEEPQKLLSRFEAGLSSRGAIHLPLRQSLPNVPAIDPDSCLHLNRESCGICEEICEAEAIRFDDRDRDEEVDVGAVILAPGSNEFQPEIKHELGYGRLPNVISSIQFERILSASGPYQGHVVRPSDRRPPKKVAFLQCVGSRDISSGNEYCSAVCCMYAIKEAVIAKEHLKTIEPAIFFMDLRAYGKDFDRYYEKAQTEHGIRFIRSRVAGIEKAGRSDDLILTYTSENGEVIEEKFDLVVLSVGLEARHKHRLLAKRLGLRLNEFGFIDTGLLFPHQTSRPGVFVGGSASGPKDIPETVAQSSGAAADAAEILAERRGTEVMPEIYPPERDIRGEPTRIGLFICNCGINIGGVVDVPEVVEYGRSLPGVAYIEENLFTCSQDTQERIKEAIEKYNLNRVVVASCSPRTHEPLFQETMKEAGLNPGLFEMANIRDQCSWTHMFQPEEATLKAKDLVRMSAAKAALLEPLEKFSLDIIQQAVVIGGGLAGMTAALSLARQGFEAALLERDKELGGNLRKIHSIVSGENIREYLLSLIDEVKRHPLIKVYRQTEIEEIDGYIGNYRLRIAAKGRKPPLELEAGVIIVATGGEEYQTDEYLRGKDKRVITQLELEAKISEVRSQKAEVRRQKTEDGKGETSHLSSDLCHLSSVVMIQCVGSRDDRHPYCSRVCCTEAIKNALKLKELNPDAQIYILYRDIRTYGFYERYYRQAREKGIIFLRYDKDEKPVLKKAGKKLRLELKDLVLDRNLVIHPDLVVIAPAIVPRGDADRISQMLKVPLNDDGFFLEAHVKLRPVDFATDGVFLAGLAHSPKMISESISQAKAAAARAATILSKKTIETEGKVARVIEERCSACGICAEVCPFKAVEIDEGKGVAVINEALCKGCGACAASCRSAAIDLKGFRDDQILAILNTL